MKWGKNASRLDVLRGGVLGGIATNVNPRWMLVDPNVVDRHYGGERQVFEIDVAEVC